MTDQTDTQQEDLVEFKADGEDSSIADPIATKSNKRKADKDQGDKAPLKMEAPKESSQGGGSTARPADKSNGMSMEKVKEDVAQMFAGQDLDEDFVSKAEVIYEAAVAARINEEVARLEEEFEIMLSEAIEEKKSELDEQVDKYLSYAVEEWVKENEIAIETSVKHSVAESFIESLQNLMSEHYVDLPEEQVSVVEELSDQIEEMKARLDEEVAKNAEMKSLIEAQQFADALEEICEGLADTQVEKMKKLVEGIESSSVEEFKRKAQIVKNNYFPAQTTVSESVDNDPVEEQREVTGTMSAYVNAIQRTVKSH